MENFVEEVPISFTCEHASLVGVLHVPIPAPKIGVVIVVGGPQYRVGSHRQFVLLARALAQRGVAVLRFDCRGMGDSEGHFAGFEHISPDVMAAVEFMLLRLPTLDRVALWGLCDATLAICACARRNPRIAGVVLLNPWVHTPEGQARTRLKHYYARRIRDMEFARKLWRGDFDLLSSARDFLTNLRNAIVLSRWRSPMRANSGQNRLAEAMASELRRFRGTILIVLSGEDLTGQEFMDAASGSPVWRRLLLQPRVTVRRLVDADHTFSRREWRDSVAEWTFEWLNTATPTAEPDRKSPVRPLSFADRSGA